MKKKYLLITILMIFSFVFMLIPLKNQIPLIDITNQPTDLPTSKPTENLDLSIQTFNTSGPVYIYVGESLIGNEFYDIISYDLKMVFSTATIENDTVSLKNDSIIIGGPSMNNITNNMVLDGNLSLDMST